MTALPVVGVDPGLSGAVAVLSPAGEIIRLEDLPVIRNGKISWIDGGRFNSILIDSLYGRPARAIVERVGARPGQGVSSSFVFGCGFGSVLSILQARHLPIELVTSAQWKRALGLSSDKRQSLDRARLLFPTADLSLAKHEGRAESLLIAHFALTRHSPGAAA